MLASFRSEQQTQSDKQRGDLARAAATNRSAVGGVLNGFHMSRGEMSRRLHGSLERGRADRSAAVDSTLSELESARRALATSLRNSLAQDASARSATVAGKLADLEKGRHILARSLLADLSRSKIERKNSVGALLRGCHEARRQMSRALTNDLARGSASRKTVVSRMLDGFQEAHVRLLSEHRAAHEEWRKLAMALHSTTGPTVNDVVERNGGASRAEPSVPPTSAAGPQASEPAIDENPEFVAMRNRVFEYLGDRPDGTRLVEIEEEMGVSRFQMSRILRSLMEENMVEKRDLLYFAI